MNKAVGDSTGSKFSSRTHVQLVFTDLSNIMFCKVVTRAMFEKHFKTKGTSVVGWAMMYSIVGDGPLDNKPGQVIFIPDSDMPLRSIQAWAPKGLISFGSFVNSSGEPFAHCPRSFLFKQASLLRKAELQVTFGFELEFFILNKDGTPVRNIYFQESWKILTEIVETLTDDLGIPVWCYHAEFAPGQFEISIGPFVSSEEQSILHAADSLILARQAIRGISEKWGKKVTFVPKPFDSMPSGAHIHISLQRNSKNLFEDFPEEANFFLAGVLQNLRNLMLILAPTENSYKRLKPQRFTGAYQCYGTENREASIRLIKNQEGFVSRFEVRPPDGTSNPYLVLGSLIAAGLQGIQERKILPDEITVNPGTLPSEKQPPQLPSSLEDAIEAFENSEFNKRIFGKELCDLILRLRKKEQKFWITVTDKRKLELLLKLY